MVAALSGRSSGIHQRNIVLNISAKAASQALHCVHAIFINTYAVRVQADAIALVAKAIGVIAPFRQLENKV